MEVIFAFVIEGLLIVYCSYTVWISLATWIAWLVYLIVRTNLHVGLVILILVVAMYWEVCLMNYEGIIFVPWYPLLIPIFTGNIILMGLLLMSFFLCLS